MVSVILESSDLQISVVLSGMVVRRGRCGGWGVNFWKVSLCQAVLVTCPGHIQAWGVTKCKTPGNQITFPWKEPMTFGSEHSQWGEGQESGGRGRTGSLFSLWNLKQGATGNFQDWITDSRGPMAGMSGITRDSATRDLGWWPVQLAPF